MDALAAARRHEIIAVDAEPERAEGMTDESLSLGEQVALEELAERVSAARSIY